MRLDIYQMFSDFRQPFKLKWGRMLHGGFPKFVDALEVESNRFGCRQEVTDGFITWYDRDDIRQAMFCFPDDAGNFEDLFSIFQQIGETRPPVTFIFIEQKSDGEGNYDVFRISERSYLEHNNRMRFRG